MTAIALGLSFLVVIVVTLLLVEVRQYRAGRHLISRRRLALRLVAGVLLIGLCAAIFLGLLVLRLTDPARNPTLFLGFWSGCLAAAAALVLVMLWDMREVGSRLRERQHEMWRDMARLVARSLSPGPADKGSGGGGEGEE